MTTLHNLQCLLVQSQLFWADAGANRRQLESIARERGAGCDLIVFPETFTSGFLGDAEAEPETMQGATVAWLQSLAAELGSVLCGSVAIATGQGRVNRFLWAQPDGVLHYYDKRHLFRMAREDQHYAVGDQRLVVNLKGWRVCPLVCYDLRFPVWSRNRGDYDVLLYAANWPSRRRTAWSALLRARAIENVCYVVGVNRVGKDGNGASYTGDSVALDFLGEVLGGERGGDFVETVVLDRESLATYRRDFPVHLDADEFELRATAT